MVYIISEAYLCSMGTEHKNLHQSFVKKSKVKIILFHRCKGQLMLNHS